MSFGFSPSDIIAVVNLAWSTYRKCKTASKEYASLSQEAQSIHLVLKEIHEDVLDPKSSLRRRGAGREADFSRILANCRSTLKDLNEAVDKYKSLGTQSQRTWDRLGYSRDEMKVLRDRLEFHLNVVNAFLTSVNTSALSRIEQRLDDIAAEIRSGKREASVLSTYGDGPEDVFRLLRRELKDEGVSARDLEEHRPAIKAYLKRLVTSGGLDEQPPPAYDGLDSDDTAATESDGTDPEGLPTEDEAERLRSSLPRRNDPRRQTLPPHQEPTGTSHTRTHMRTEIPQADDLRWTNYHYATVETDESDNGADESLPISKSENSATQPQSEEVPTRTVPEACSKVDFYSCSVCAGDQRTCDCQLRREMRGNTTWDSLDDVLADISDREHSISCRWPNYCMLLQPSSLYRAQPEHQKFLLYPDLLCSCRLQTLFPRPPIVESMMITLPRGWRRLESSTGLVWFEHEATGAWIHAHPSTLSRELIEARNHGLFDFTFDGENLVGMRVVKGSGLRDPNLREYIRGNGEVVTPEFWKDDYGEYHTFFHWVSKETMRWFLDHPSVAPFVSRRFFREVENEYDVSGYIKVECNSTRLSNVLEGRPLEDGDDVWIPVFANSNFDRKRRLTYPVIHRASEETTEKEAQRDTPSAKSAQRGGKKKPTKRR